jgi:predicted alpha/beta superfamily hydrolase
MRVVLISFFSLISIHILSQNQLSVVSGKIEHVSVFPSKYTDPRTIDIWLPDGYSEEKKYSVIYMHDGQMLFDSSTTWNKQSWDVDDKLTQLLKDKEIKNTIVVGIWNNGVNRHAEYFPQKPFESFSKQEKDSISIELQRIGRTDSFFMPISDNYLKCIVEEIKPMIDETFAVRKGRKHTFIMGSSMGGLISLYAICEYPKVFGGAACLSTHWPGIFKLENNPIPNAFINYLKHNLPSPRLHKLYFDCGDQTLDSLYPEIQMQVNRVLIEAGYSSKNCLTKYFPGNDHSEASWKKRLNFPLIFLLKN